MIEPTFPTSSASPWLLLIHQLPAQPAYLRVKVWRRLQALGAVAVKNAVYALPAGDRAQEDFAWLLQEIRGGGGEAVLCGARLAGGLDDAEMRALFNRARDTDYEALVKEARDLAAALDDAAERGDARAQLARLRARLAQIAAIDFFEAAGRHAADAALARIDALLAGTAPTPASASPVPIGELTGRTWVTREGVHIDRVASAWLIRGFIDPAATFRFVPAHGHAPRPGEVRFDMFEAEFTHEGDRCTFEVLLERAGLAVPALTALAEIVHDLDLKDAKFGRAEAAGIGALIDGIAMASADDPERLARGAAVFDGLYHYFRKQA